MSTQRADSRGMFAHEQHVLPAEVAPGCAMTHSWIRQAARDARTCTPRYIRILPVRLHDEAVDTCDIDDVSEAAACRPLDDEGATRTFREMVEANHQVYGRGH